MYAALAELVFVMYCTVANWFELSAYNGVGTSNSPSLTMLLLHLAFCHRYSVIWVVCTSEFCKELYRIA